MTLEKKLHTSLTFAGKEAVGEALNVLHLGKLLPCLKKCFLGFKLGNCDINAEQKILFINETKRYEILLRIFEILHQNFGLF